jgi:hypothetical protein
MIIKYNKLQQPNDGQTVDCIIEMFDNGFTYKHDEESATCFLLKTHIPFFGIEELANFIESTPNFDGHRMRIPGKPWFLPPAAYTDILDKVYTEQTKILELSDRIFRLNNDGIDIEFLKKERFANWNNPVANEKQSQFNGWRRCFISKKAITGFEITNNCLKIYGNWTNPELPPFNTVNECKQACELFKLYLIM